MLPCHCSHVKLTAVSQSCAKLVPRQCADWSRLSCWLAGSGKTLAYLLPTYAHILSSSSAAATQLQEESGAAAAAAVQPRVLVLLPSRELAQQVHGQCTALFAVTGVSTAVVYGGVPKDQQVRDSPSEAGRYLIEGWNGG